MAQTANKMKEADISLDICRVAGLIGAEISGVRLTGNLPPAMVKAIWSALCRHKVLFFRNQNHLTDSEHENFAALFGDILDHPTVPAHDGTKHITQLDSRRGEKATFWHTDTTFFPTPALASILRAVEVPKVGGDTMWANCAAAYQSLDSETKAFAEKLRGIHSNAFDYGGGPKQSAETKTAAMNSSFRSAIYETEQPLVHVHPETGERSLLAGGFLRAIAGFSAEASRHLIGIFRDAITEPEHIVRWRWAAGDVAIWDNRATQHYAIDDYGNETRIMRRVTLAGFAPVGVDGRGSRLLSKTEGSSTQYGA